MVYDWDGKREICYQMYIRDKKALEEIMDYMRNVYQFSPRYAITRPVSNWQLTQNASVVNVHFKLNSNGGDFLRNRIQHTKMSSSSRASSHYGKQTQAREICSEFSMKRALRLKRGS
jgi:hypothetical protein